jgi:hypothetical protein
MVKVDFVRVQVMPYLHIRVKPNGKTDQLFYDEAGQLTAKIKAPAQDGKANEYLVKFLAKTLGVPRSAVRLVSGFTNPHKKVEINASEEEIRQKLAELTV